MVDKVLAIWMSRSDNTGMLTSTDGSHRDTQVSDFAWQIEDPDNSSTPVTDIPFYHDPTASETTWYHFMWRSLFAPGNNDDGNLMQFRDAQNRIVFHFDMLNGVWEGQVQNGLTTDTSTGVAVPIIKTRMDVKIVVDATDITASVYIDGNAIATTVNTLAKNNRTVPVQFRLRSTDMAYDMYLSEMYCAEYDTRDTLPVRQRPDADGNYSEWTGDFAPLGDDNAATFISVAAGGKKFTANITAYRGPGSPDSIREVVIKTLASKPLIGPSNIRTMVRIDSTDYFGANLDPPDVSAGVAYTAFINNPNTAVPWVVADLDTTEFGVESVS